MVDKLKEAYPDRSENFFFWTKEDDGRLAVQLVAVHQDYWEQLPHTAYYNICKVVHNEIEQLEHFSIMPLAPEEYEDDAAEHVEAFNETERMGKSKFLNDIIEETKDYVPDTTVVWRHPENSPRDWNLEFVWDPKTRSFSKY